MKLPSISSRGFYCFLLFVIYFSSFSYLRAQSPGNVSTNLELWLKADAGVTGTSPVTAWADQSVNGLDATAVNSPALVTDGLNFNPTINFDGTSARFTTAAMQLFSTNTSPVSIIIVFDTDASEGEKFLLMQDHTSGTDNVELGYDTGAGSGSGNYGLGVGSSNATIAPASTIADNTFNIMSSLILNTGNSPANINIFQNGQSLTPADDNSGFVNAGSYNTGSSSILNIGARDTGTPDAFHDGDIAELIVYSQQLSSTDRQQIESYLAVKYGVAIDQTSATNYLASDGGVIWNGTTNATYNTDIAGIGRDDNSGLDQQKSSSVNSGAILTIANGDITTPSSFSANDSWLIWGHDNGAITFGSGNFENSDGTTSNRMNRVWKVQETGTVGNVEIAFSNTHATGTVSIVIDPTDNTFANNAERRIIEMVDSGSDYEVTVDLVDGEFFSFVNASASVLTTKPVLINEVVVTPRQDWSSGNFYDASPGGTAGSDDEWVELYIASDGLDLTSWTIELNDASPVTGDLTSTGAFDVSNYLSTSGGSFTSTATGDYLILGNVDGSGAINSTGTTTINLKNSSGLIIDQVVISNSSGTGFNGSSTDATDESISRVPNGTDTNVNATDYSKTRATLGTTNSPSGIVKINEVVTDPFTDWSTTGFNGVDGASTVSDVDEWIELYVGTAGINLTGWTIDMTDGTDESGELTTTGGGVFATVNYVTSGSGSFIDTEVGDYLVLGNPDGAMNNDVLIVLYDASGTEIDRVQLGGGSGQAPDGANSSASTESIARYANAIDTDADDADFIQTISTLGSTNSLSGTVLINEIVTDPQQDWSTNGFDGTVAGGTVDTDDEWIELYIGTAGINLTSWSIELTDGTNVTGDLTATGAFEVSNYISNTAGSSFLSTAVGDYLVLGNVAGADVNEDDILITLRDATGTLIDEVELGDDPAGNGAGNGAPDGSADGGDATGISDESISRILNATDTDNDINDFSEAPASLGIANSLTALAGVGNGLDFDGTDDYVDMGDIGLTSGTISMWLNADDVNDNRRIYSQLTGATTQAGPIGIDPNNLDDFGIFVWSGAAWLQLVDVGSDWSGTWHHLAVVYAAGSATAYWDGVEQMTQTTNMDFNGVSMGLAAQYTGANGTTFNGQIDELRIWSDIRTHEEIVENMFSTMDGTELNLSAYYNFDQSSGTSLPDIVASSDGNLMNMAGSEWTAAGWNTFSQNEAILRTGGANTTPGTSGELTLTNVDFLNDNNDILLAGHENSDFIEVTNDLPSGTLITARYNRNWHMTKNDASGTANGNVDFSFDLGSAPNTNITYYLLERASTTGNFSIVPVDGINPSGNSIVFRVNTSQIDNGSYYTVGRSDAGVGNSLDFDGTDDYVDLGAQILSSTAFTVEAWINASSLTSSTRLNRILAIDFGSYSTDNPFALFVNDGGSIGYVLGTGDANNDIQAPLSFSPTLSTSSWYHVALSFDGSTKTLYVNGVLEGTISDAGTFTNTNSEQLLIGDFATATTDVGEWEGQIDEVRIWDDVRTHAEIVNNMFGSLAGDEANLTAYYRMNQGIGNSDTNLPDLSGDNNNGTLTNFANLGGVTTPSNYLAATRTTFGGIALIVNGGTLSAASDELTLTSTQTAGDFLQDAGDQIIWGNDGGAFTETTADVPTATTLVTNRIAKTWNIDKNDEVGTADGNVTFSFDLGTTPNKDVTYYLLSRTGTSGDFSVVEVIDSDPNGNSIEFTVDGAQITDENYFTLGRSGTGTGNGVDLDGTDDYVLIPDAGSLDITGTLTIEAWVNLGTAPGGDEGIVAKFLTAGTEESYSLDINTSRNVEFKVTNDGSTRIEVTSATAITTGTWTHIAAVYTPNTSLQIYIDGVLDAENTSGIPVSLHPGTADLWIGATSALGVANNHVDALIDEVRVWNVARSKADILGDIHNNLTGNETGLVAYYRFNLGDAGNTNTGLDVVPDRSGNANSGTLTNLALSGASSNWLDSDALVVAESSSQSLLGPGNALDFDGTDDHVLVADNATLESSSTLTVEAWLRPTSVASRQSAVSRYFTNPDASNVFLLDISASAVLAFTVNESDNNLVSASSTIAANTWTHVAGVADGSNIHIYVNGILEASTAYDGTLTSNSTRSLVIGRTRQEDVDGPFVGQIDEVRIWSSARDATQIQDNMYEELTGSETGLVAYYQFDEVAGTGTVTDESTNSNTGTLTSMDAANDWVDAAAREPFKTTGAGNWNSTDTWKSGTVPNVNTADLNISHNIALNTNITVGNLNVNSGSNLNLNNSQTLTIEGDLINNGTITGGGTLSFAGTGAQDLTAGTYSNVTLSNTADEITLAGNATFTGTLTLTNGNLVLGTNNLIINSGGSISGGGTSSYIQTINQNSSGGTLQMEVANGAGPVVFPIGTSTYTPFTMVNLGTTGDFTLRVLDGTYEDGTSGAAHSSNEEINRTWDVNALGSGYNSTITIQWNGTEEDASFTRNSMFISLNDATGAWIAATGTISASGSDPYTATASGITSFSQVGGGSGSSPLPVTLMDFDASLIDEAIRLDWQTATEINNHQFEVERSNDGIAFSMIGSVEGAGNSQEIVSYTYSDQSPRYGDNYYRLKQVDYDGNFEYSSIVMAVFEPAEKLFTVFPNPFSNELTIKMNQDVKGLTQLIIYNLAGEIIRSLDLQLSGQTTLGSLNLKNGMYFLEINYNGQRFRNKVIKN